VTGQRLSARPRHPRLQATFLPGEHAIAWWGVPDIDAALDAAALPPGHATTLRLAVPDGGGVAAADVPVRLTALPLAVRALAGLERSAGLGASVIAWKQASRLVTRSQRPSQGGPDAAFADLATRMPAAAHAVLNADETAIRSPDALLTDFRSAIRTATVLGDGLIRADLRPYQVQGVSWLRERTSRHEGGILADEMGLGKTLQAICALATRTTDLPHMVVCPTSLIGNWQREISRFSPTTPVVRYHGTDRALPAELPPGVVVLTSYPLLRSDDLLVRTAWDVVVFDEAQQLKNPGSQVTRAAARLSATARIAMTGTPVENRLEELWSIFSVTNPGLLGSRARFRQRFIVPIHSRRSATATATLNELVQPHMLRRTKAQVATELPPKQESTVVCTLTDEQIKLYRDAQERAFNDGFGGGSGRSGRILALLTELKQICNHPAQYLGSGPARLGRSGKFDRASEMLAEIVEEGDRALVFTQYRTMGELLSAGLGHSLGTGPIPFLHGGLSAAQRDELVRAFQEDEDAPPVLILSLRAAGFGLNLTRASHVMHFDRWWNPAVEEQATARAHRIGQQRTLNVYTLVTGGTIEDHIDRMHQIKQGVADLLASQSEAALTTLPDEQLRGILELDLTAVS
jgi:SNF2 family DNA or RNA helicase